MVARRGYTEDVMAKKYVEQHDSGYYIAGTRVSLDSVVCACRRGESVTQILESFPVLSLEQVDGAVDFYLANRTLVDEYLRDQQSEVEQMRAAARLRNPELHAKMAQAREKLRA